ncbi:MAG: DUF2934 domain-containing protein [Phycisphaerales bacterium]|nr:DUF2934 domain-containing protein [Phycisphaerales bacterium]
MTHHQPSAVIDTVEERRPKRRAAATPGKKKAGQAGILLEPLPTLLPPAPPPAPTEDEIRFRAYLIYLSRAGQPGSPSEDWRLAEQELRAGIRR